jgi:hypothetical protein
MCFAGEVVDIHSEKEKKDLKTRMVYGFGLIFLVVAAVAGCRGPEYAGTPDGNVTAASHTGIGGEPLAGRFSEGSSSLAYFDENGRLVQPRTDEHGVRTAAQRERQLKKWRREKKVALIESVNPNWKDLAKQDYPLS